MSEYNRFLSHFNKNKTAPAQENSSADEDIIPVTGSIRKQKEESSPVIQEENVKNDISSDAGKTAEVSLPDKTEDTDNQDEIILKNTVSEKKSRFIKTGDAQFIAVNSKNRQDIPTEATKYTDRLLPKIPEKKISAAKNNPNSYDEIHSPSTDTKMFRTANQEGTDNTSEEIKTASPENTADDKTKIIPTVIQDEKTKASEDETKEIIVEKIPDGKTKDLSEKGSLLRKIAKTSGQADDIDEGQLVIEGFSDEEDTASPDSTDDEEMLKELSRVRADRIKNFRFWSKSEEKTGESEDKSFSPQREELPLPSFLLKIREKFSHLDTSFAPMGDSEYQDPAKRKEVFSSLMSLKKTTLIKALLLAILGTVLLIINITASVSAAMNNGFFTVFGGSAVAYSIVNLIMLVLCGAVMADDLKKGIFSVLKIRPRTDTALLLMYVGAAAQTIASFFSTLKPESEYHLLSGAVILLSVPMLLAKALYYDSARQCFKAVGTTSDKCYLRKISDKDTISELLRDNNPIETNVVYTGKTRFISGFLKRSANAAFSGQISSRFIVIATAGAVGAGIIGLIATRSPVYALGCLCLTSALSFPVGCLVFTGYMLSMENNVLSVKASYINSYSDAHSFSLIDDIVLDGDEVFSAEIISSVSAANVSQKQAEFCAAVLTDKAGGILKNAFSVFSQGLQDRYPEVEGLIYENRLGLSAWISDCRVLLGTKEFLVNHNVELPEANTVPFISDETTKPLFLAIEGHFAAAFSVKYSCDKITSESLGSLASNGANILLTLKEPNITEDFGEELLGLPANSLRIMHDSSNSKFRTQQKTVTDMEDTGIVFSESFDAFSRTLAGAIKLEKIRKTAKMIYEAASVAGLLLGLLFCITNAVTFINGWPAVVIQLCFMLLSFALIPSLSAASLKKKITISENPKKSIPDFSENDSDLPDFDDDIFGTEKNISEESINEDIADGTDEDGENDEELTSPENELVSGIKKKLRSVFTDRSAQTVDIIPEEAAEQLEIDGAFSEKPPQVVDPDKLLKEKELEEEAREKEEKADNAPELTDDILDSFAGEYERKTASSEKTYSKKGLFGKRPAKKSLTDNSVDKEDSPVKKKTVFSILDEKLPTPPKFDLNKKDSGSSEDDDDPLKAKFIPPDTSAYQTYYKDDFFSSFDTEEDDKAFADIRKKREERESTADEFDFWTKK